MLRPVLTALLLLSVAAPAFAQQGEPPPAPAQQDPSALVRRLERDLEHAVAEWRKAAVAAAEQAKAAGEPMPAIPMAPPTGPFVERALQLAADRAGTDAAVPFLGFVLAKASRERDEVRRALTTLRTDHAASPAVRPLLGGLVGAYFHHAAADEVTQLLDAVIANNADADTRAAALLERGALRLQVAADDEAARKVAADDVREAQAATQDPALRARAADVLFEIEHLQIGCTAPDIVGTDVEGVAFKLSDHRGKVVLLDFWGFW